MGKIIVIGLGPGDPDLLTIGAVKVLKKGYKVYLRTEKHPTVSFLYENNIEFESYDFMYEKGEDFDVIYENIAKDLVKKSEEHGIIIYCIPGHPLVAEKTVSLLTKYRDEGEVEVQIYSGVSFIDSVINAVQKDPISGMKVVDGLNLSMQSVDINVDNIITQVYNRMIASEVKLKLMEVYDDEYQIYVIRAAGVPGEEKILRIPLYELDRIEWIDYLTSIYIPKIDDENRSKYDLNNLINIMQKLRSKEGCPWDIKQTHQSLREYVLEEAYEVVDAIDKDDMDLLAEELGDLLLQVVFHAQIGKEEGYFTIWDVISSICSKLINRHPHVFGESNCKDSEEVMTNWNRIKDKEKNIESHSQRLESIAKGLPALIKSFKLQQKAADIGFDWPDVNGALEKVKEEFQEVLIEIKENNKNRIEEEIGDLLFAVVNISRFLKVNPEIALNKTINKFIERFKLMEDMSRGIGKDLQFMTLKEMDELWERTKIHKNKKIDKK
ncbi:nucleotide pyrophosphohydrolase [Caloranaerobacter sp. TR13]|uniref:nucleoside triphosphate pyrophosphohydrolase n=1 Tax=Caloranaerobacter sp. TR13 TaxID=1302151 RepID=UPI0006D3E9F3|nr:nucleoside triphosphate pyrophosphohydrolase [Caloranaerobacter sp. TR13]KPU26594.1 nucleotide pyrophosphohydrolase [Caloranaerobacter sp. TR13]